MCNEIMNHGRLLFGPPPPGSGYIAYTEHGRACCVSCMTINVAE